MGQAREGSRQVSVTQMCKRASSRIAVSSLGVALLAFVFSGMASASDLVSPFSIDNGRVLPKNVSNPRFLFITLANDSRFNGLGKIEPLAQPLNKAVLPSDLLATQTNDYDRTVLASFLEAYSFKDPIGHSRGAIRTNVRVMAPAIGYGVTDTWTIGVAAPIFNIDVDVLTGFDQTAEGSRFLKQLEQQNPLKAAEAAMRINAAANGKVIAMGYKPLTSQTARELGDIQFVNKVSLIQNSAQSLAIKPVVIFPTGTQPDADAMIDTATSDGRYKLNTSIIHDIALGSNWRWSKQIGYTLFLPHQFERRIPFSTAELLSPDKEVLTRELGTVLLISTGLETVIPRLGVVLSAGYHYQYQAQARFSGSNPEWIPRYRALEELNPAQNLHSFTVSAGFSSVEWYRTGHFVYPFEAYLALSQPITGTNVPTSRLVTGELVLFF
jgi:hypothetical protein